MQVLKTTVTKIMSRHRKLMYDMMLNKNSIPQNYLYYAYSLFLQIQEMEKERGKVKMDIY